MTHAGLFKYANKRVHDALFVIPANLVGGGPPGCKHRDQRWLKGRTKA